MFWGPDRLLCMGCKKLPAIFLCDAGTKHGGNEQVVFLFVVSN